MRNSNFRRLTKNTKMIRGSGMSIAAYKCILARPCTTAVRVDIGFVNCGL
ncbi:MAG TPA: hypothetical protein VE378_03085 [Nitrososphaeraceae archaeon]|nr:hypothetical protein [Nitrososphaeraceae archaeon]